MSRTPALNLLHPRQTPATVAHALHARMARQRGHFLVVVRPNGDVIEYPPSRLPTQDLPHQIGRYSWRIDETDLADDLAAAQTVLRAQQVAA